MGNPIKKSDMYDYIKMRTDYDDADVLLVLEGGVFDDYPTLLLSHMASRINNVNIESYLKEVPTINLCRILELIDVLTKRKSTEVAHLTKEVLNSEAVKSVGDSKQDIEESWEYLQMVVTIIGKVYLIKNENYEDWKNRVVRNYVDGYKKELGEDVRYRKRILSWEGIEDYLYVDDSKIIERKY